MRGPVDPAQNTPLCDYTLMPTHMRYRFAVEELQDIQLAAPFSFFDTENFVIVTTISLSKFLVPKFR